MDQNVEEVGLDEVSQTICPSHFYAQALIMLLSAPALEIGSVAFHWEDCR